MPLYYEITTKSSLNYRTALIEVMCTCVPDVLYPDVCTSGEEEPVHRDKEKADHVTGQSNTDKEYWERLNQIYKYNLGQLSSKIYEHSVLDLVNNNYH